MSNSYICLKCNSKFKNKQTLNIHQKTSETCSPKEQVESDDKNCFYCGKEFSSKQMKRYHENKCSNKQIYELEVKHRLEIKNLKSYYETQIQNLLSQ